MTNKVVLYKNSATHLYCGGVTKRKTELARKVYAKNEKWNRFGASKLMSYGKLSSDELTQVFKHIFEEQLDEDGRVHPMDIIEVEYDRLDLFKGGNKKTYNLRYYKEWKQSFAIMVLINILQSTYCDGFDADNPFDQTGPGEFSFELTGDIVVEVLPRRKKKAKWRMAFENDEYFEFKRKLPSERQ